MLARTDSAKRPRVGIISSYDEICGIAHYAKALRDTLSSDYDVEVLALPQDLMRASDDRAEIAAADARIDEIVAACRDLDAVSVQLEWGLFGQEMARARPRIKKILKAHPRMVVEFHSVHRRRPLKLLDAARNLLMRRHHVLGGIYGDLAKNAFWTGIFKAINQIAEAGGVAVIAHAKRDALFLQACLPRVPVFDTPLTYFSAAQRDAMLAQARFSPLQVRLAQLDWSRRYVGVFGFIANHKGFESVIEMMDHLPDDVDLLLFASVHNSSMPEWDPIHPTLRNMLDRIDASEQKAAKRRMIKPVIIRRPLSERIHFVGAVADEDIPVGMMMCDSVILPYLNVALMASGPMALANEFDRHIISTRTRAALEFEKYFPGSLDLVDIGNARHFAQRVVGQRGRIAAEEMCGQLRFVYYQKRAKPYDPDRLLQLYRKAWGFAPPPALSVAAFASAAE